MKYFYQMTQLMSNNKLLIKFTINYFTRYNTQSSSYNELRFIITSLSSGIPIVAVRYIEEH